MNEALGWTLFHFLWEGATVALLLAIVLLTVRAARVRYAAACLAMFAMLAAFGITLAIQLPKKDRAPVSHVLAGAPPKPGDAPDSGARMGHSSLPYTWAVPVWLAGVALFSLHRLLGFAAACRLRRVGVCIAPEPWPERLSRLAARMGVKRQVLLLESCLAEVPAAAGYLRPAILLPIGLLAGLPSEQVEFLLIHELAHIARRDYLVNLLQSVVEALLFYHPAMWWVSSVIRAEREHCCDDAVVALAGNPHAYAAALVTLEQARVPRPALAATGGNLSGRVRRLLRQPAPSQSLAAPLAAAALVVLIVSVALAAGRPEQIAPPNVPLAHPAAPALVAQAQTAEPQPQVTPRDPYRAWLNEDVAYIITDAERSAFKQLTTDAEREQFIESFWQRRDPTPNTVENEFKEEHYRRIAYANEHYSAAIPGSKTDRGRIYITYGPPDEIEDHGSGSTTAAPFQQWRYRYIEGVGTNVIVEFVDSARNGEYRMTMDPHKADALQSPRAVQLNTPPAAPHSGPANHFVANEPGGRASVIVTGRVATVSVPVAASGKFEITGTATDQTGQTPASFRNMVTNQSVPLAFPLTLAPGAYTLKITIRNLGTGELSNESVYFYVTQ